MKNPFKPKSEAPTVVPEVQVCELAKIDAVAKLRSAEQRLRKSARLAIQYPTDESRIELEQAQNAKNKAELYVSQCDMAIEDANEVYAGDLVKAEAARKAQAWQKIEKTYRPQIEQKAKKIKANLDEAISDLFEIAKLGTEASNLAPELDGTSIQDSLIAGNRIIGYFRQHIRKCGGDSGDMAWAFPFFSTEGIHSIPDFDKSIQDALDWLTKMAPKNQPAKNQPAQAKK